MIEVQQTPQEVALPKSKEDEPFTLERLVERIHQILGPDGGLDSEHIGTGEILRLMESYSSNAADWSKYAFFDHSRAYTRNLVDDGNGKFNLIILAWSKGQQSPIHDHSGSHCIMKVLDGELQETQYAWPSDQATAAAAEAPADCTDITAAPNADSPRQSQSKGGQPLKVTKDGILKPNQVTYIHDKIGLHRISNPNAERGAVSLHLYTPPYEMCKTFEADTGRARSSGKCSFYTIQGQRCVQ